MKPHIKKVCGVLRWWECRDSTGVVGRAFDPVEAYWEWYYVTNPEQLQFIVV